MPCTDNRNDCSSETNDRQESKIRFLETSLCAALTSLASISNGEKFNGELDDENTVEDAKRKSEIMIEALNLIDYKEAGIKRIKLTEWWFDHLDIDVKRRQREQKQKAKAELVAELRAAAISKLTPAERKALNL